jgi:hypothetical protein
MREFFYFIIWILIIYVYIATFLFWFWSYKGKLDKLSNNKQYYLFIGSLIGVGAFFYGGAYNILFFIPESWGHISRDDGDFVSSKSFISGIIATVLTLFIHSKPEQIIKFLKGKRTY